MASKSQFTAVMNGSASPKDSQALFDAAPQGLGVLGILQLIFSAMTLLNSTSFSKVVADIASVVASIRAGTFNWAATVALFGADAQIVYSLVQQIAAAFGLQLPPIPTAPAT